MTTLFARGGSLAALAVAIALALPATPAAAQDRPDYRNDSANPAPTRVERAQQRSSPERVRIERGDAPPRASVLPPRAERSEAPRPRGFGGDVFARAQAAQAARQAEQRGAERAGRTEARGDQRANRGDWRGEQRENRAGQRGDARAGQMDWQGRDTAARQVDRRSERIGNGSDIRTDRIENRAERRTDRNAAQGDGWRGDGRRDIRARGGGGGFNEQVGDIARDARRADDWRNGRGEDWRDGRRNDWRDGRRGDWRDGRRDGWREDRRNWRRDDWRHSWNGRPGWDNRDFRRWNNGWRNDRRFDWFDYRRGNRFLFSPGRYYAPFQSHRYSRLNQGFFLDSLFFQPRFFINDPWAYRLPPAYGPYQWVRYYDDVVLVDIYTGEVVDVIHGFFW